jgi:hypothetical protein
MKSIVSVAADWTRARPLAGPADFCPVERHSRQFVKFVSTSCHPIALSPSAGIPLSFNVLSGLGGMRDQLLGTGEEMLLVFYTKQSMIMNMEKSWYRKMFSHSQKPDQEVTPPNADYGDADVHFSRGLKFANGEGATRDYAQAAEWYHKAADQSHSLAQFNLGMMYAHGQGVTRDAAQSVMWYGRAARQGDAGAQFNLGESCHRASLQGERKDAPESRIEAYKWYRLAAAQGYQDSETAYTTLTINMTREDVAVGNRRVAEFKVEKPKHPHE